MSESKTSNFMLAVATVMLGPRAKLYELNPIEHSIGLVKNFSLNNEESSTELTSGIMNDLEFSVVTQSDTRASMEVYEYTAQNISYAMGLAGYDIEEVSGDPFAVSQVGVNNSDKTHNLTLTKGATPQPLAVNDMVSIRFPDDDRLLLAKVVDASALDSTGVVIVQADINASIIPSGSVVQRVTVVDLGAGKEKVELAAKIQGQLADGTWIQLLLPKVKMSSSFSAAFSAENYGNMPFELKGYKVKRGEPFYADFKGTKGKLAKDAVASSRV